MINSKYFLLIVIMLLSSCTSNSPADPTPPDEIQLPQTKLDLSIEWPENALSLELFSSNENMDELQQKNIINFEQNQNKVLVNLTAGQTVLKASAFAAPDAQGERLNSVLYNIDLSENTTVDYTLSFPEPSVPDRVRISSPLEQLRPGEKLLLIAEAFDVDEAVIQHTAFQWESSDSSVIAISETGWIQALKPGVSYVRARAYQGTAGAEILLEVIENDKL